MLRTAAASTAAATAETAPSERPQSAEANPEDRQGYSSYYNDSTFKELCPCIPHSPSFPVQYLCKEGGLLQQALGRVQLRRRPRRGEQLPGLEDNAGD